MTETALVWFRSDLRLHDNEALVEAASADELLPVYCFDPHWFGTAEYGGRESFEFQKMGPYGTRFLRESIADLRQSLRERGSDLLVRHGPSAEVVTEMAAACDADWVSYHTYPAPEERDIERETATALESAGVETSQFWGHTLYHRDDLPVDVGSINDTFTPFRKNVEANSPIREPFDVPDLPPVPGAVEPGSIPAQSDLDVDPIEYDKRGVLAFEGGEAAGVDRMAEYIWERDRLREYHETRNGMLGADYSSKFSPWLNTGCLSPRRVHEAVQAYEDERVSNKSTYWLLFELAWRDFFQFQVLKHGKQYFSREGIRERTDIDWVHDEVAFRRWSEGQTGIPFVDASMRELNGTGYMSNRGRQNVASFLSNNCRIDWRRGAAYFETQLIDHDPCSNYGNWAYVSQVGNDSRDSYFNIIKQARQYDENAEHVKHWCPELEPLPAKYAHEPWKMTSEEQVKYGVELGIDYAEPMVSLEASYEKLR